VSSVCCWAIVRRVSFEDALVALVHWLGDRAGQVAGVAVDGHSAAGKSSFARMVVEGVDAVLVTGDDFYRVMGEADRGQLSPRQGIDRY
jgi:hypothetical protein